MSYLDNARRLDRAAAEYLDAAKESPSGCYHEQDFMAATVISRMRERHSSEVLLGAGPVHAVVTTDIPGRFEDRYHALHGKFGGYVLDEETGTVTWAPSFSDAVERAEAMNAKLNRLALYLHGFDYGVQTGVQIVGDFIGVQSPFDLRGKASQRAWPEDAVEFPDSDLSLEI